MKSENKKTYLAVMVIANISWTIIIKLFAIFCIKNIKKKKITNTKPMKQCV